MQGFATVTLAVLAALMGTSTAYVEKQAEFISAPIKLRYGEVHNRFQPNMDLPADLVEEFNNKTIAIVDYFVDIVDENGNQVPLYDIYNHHYGLMVGTKDFAETMYNITKDMAYGYPPPRDLVGYVRPRDDEETTNSSDFIDYTVKSASPAHSGRKLMMMMAMMQRSNAEQLEDLLNDKYKGGFGSGSGAEERGTSHRLPEGYGYLISSPEQWTPLFHFINTRDPSLGDDPRASTTASPLLECPCTPQRVFDYANQTIDGNTPLPPFGTCNLAFNESGNPSCNLDTYVGGFRCCEDKTFVIDTDTTDVDSLPVDTVYGKFVITYLEGDADELGIKNVRGTIEDLTGDEYTMGNIEFDVPQCEQGTAPEDCIYEMSTVSFVEGINETDTSVIEMPYTVGHLHVGGLAIEMYNETTGELLCSSAPKYGFGQEAGDEAGYLVGMSSCTFDPPLVMRKNDKIRTVARYNASEPHTGVMALWLPQVHDVEAA